MRTNPVKSPSMLRACIQYGFAIFFVYTGWKFYQYYQWLNGNATEFTARPPAVEAFLPISAMLAAKRFIMTGIYDEVHPAGLTIFFMAILIAILARKGFCGYLCPVGLLTDRISRLGRILKLSSIPHRKIQLLISMPKYLLLGFFCWSILLKMNLFQINAFLLSPYNILADIKMLEFFLHPSGAMLLGIAIIIIGCLRVPGFWCRCFCPYGALLGIFALLSPLAVRRDKNSCTYCRRCTKACPTSIPLHTVERVYSPECIGCMECVDACPVEGCLKLNAGYGKKLKRLPFWIIALLCLGIITAGWVLALHTNHWQGQIPDEMLRLIYSPKATAPAAGV